MKAYLSAAALGLAMAAGGTGALAQDGAKPVRIGYLTDLSGTSSTVDGRGGVDAARMAVEDFGGKLLGRPIELVAADHQNKPDVGLSLAREWFGPGDVQMIMDLNHSAIALAVSDLARRSSKVVMATAAGTVDLTGSACSPNLVHWAMDTYALGHTLGSVLTKGGARSWYFLTINYAYGHTLEGSAILGVQEQGGKVAGTKRFPAGTNDFSSEILQAQTSGAEAIGLAFTGLDLVAATKQMREFGVSAKLAPLALYVTDVQGAGLPVMAGLEAVQPFYWDLDARTRAFAERFMKRNGRMPTVIQADAYSGMTHYLRAVEKAGTLEAETVVKQMKAMPVEDAISSGATVRADGRLMRDVYHLRVKKPGESKGTWDVFDVLEKVPAASVYRPLGADGCALR